MNLAKKNLMFRKLFRSLLYVYRYTRYKYRGIGIKVDDKTILFSTFNGKSYADSPKAIYLYLLSNEKYNDYKFIWTFKEPEEHDFLTQNERTTIVKQGTKEYEKSLAKSKYWIFNYRVADHQHPKKNQVYVQCWHGTPLKRLGYDLENSDNVLNTKREIRFKYRTDAVCRVTFNEITKETVQKSIKEPRKIDMNLTDAQQARRVLDRIVGYKISPVLWKKVQKGLSAGRVQSVAVKLIVDREEEIEKIKK